MGVGMRHPGGGPALVVRQNPEIEPYTAVPNHGEPLTVNDPRETREAREAAMAAAEEA